MITLTVENGVAEVMLDRHEKHNALNGELMSGLVDAAATIERDRPVMLVEILDPGEKPEENPVIAMLSALNYECMFYDSDGLHHLSHLQSGHKGRNFI